MGEGALREGSLTVRGPLTAFEEGALLEALTLVGSVANEGATEGTIVAGALAAAGTTSTTCPPVDVAARMLFLLIICEVAMASLKVLTLAAILFVLVLALALAMIGGTLGSETTLACASTVSSPLNPSKCFSSMVSLTVPTGLTERA